MAVKVPNKMPLRPLVVSAADFVFRQKSTYERRWRARTSHPHTFAYYKGPSCHAVNPHDMRAVALPTRSRQLYYPAFFNTKHIPFHLPSYDRQGTLTDLIAPTSDIMSDQKG